MNDALLEKYARLVVKTGANVQKGQTMVIMAPIETAVFARLIAEAAYKEGARDVIIDWRDEQFSRMRFLNAPDEVFDEFPDWKKEFYKTYLRNGSVFVQIAASDPEILKGVDVQKIARAQKVTATENKEFYDRLMNNQNSWTIVSMPTEAWAQKVFPELSVEEAVEKLWDAILKTVRVDKEDPVAAWEEHSDNLRKRMAFLNSNNFRYLHYRNSAGTDLEIELPEGHQWMGGSEKNTNGVFFNANMPTEEVFTLPLKNGINGKVVSTMPLNYNGNIIDKFSFTFKEGRITDFTAEEGYDVLKTMVETDEGSHYLGEVALVPYDSPISRLNILFYNTLFDENASCHLAIGRAYFPCLKGSGDMNQEDLEKAGANNSLIHVDFMVGSRDMEIMGVTSDGREIPVFKNGNFAF